MDFQSLEFERTKFEIYILLRLIDMWHNNASIMWKKIVRKQWRRQLLAVHLFVISSTNIGHEFGPDIYTKKHFEWNSNRSYKIGPDMIDRYEIFFSQMAMNLFHFE